MRPLMCFVLYFNYHLKISNWSVPIWMCKHWNSFMTSLFLFMQKLYWKLIKKIYSGRICHFRWRQREETGCRQDGKMSVLWHRALFCTYRSLEIWVKHLKIRVCQISKCKFCNTHIFLSILSLWERRIRKQVQRFAICRLFPITEFSAVVFRC